MAGFGTELEEFCGRRRMSEASEREHAAEIPSAARDLKLR